VLRQRKRHCLFIKEWIGTYIAYRRDGGGHRPKGLTNEEWHYRDCAMRTVAESFEATMNHVCSWPDWLFHLRMITLGDKFPDLPMDAFHEVATGMFAKHFGQVWIDAFCAEDERGRWAMLYSLNEYALRYTKNDISTYIIRICPPEEKRRKHLPSVNYNPHFYRSKGPHSTGRHKRR